MERSVYNVDKRIKALKRKVRNNRMLMVAGNIGMWMGVFGIMDMYEDALASHETINFKTATGLLILGAIGQTLRDSSQTKFSDARRMLKNLIRRQ